ncbi:MAG: sigma-54 dependent transcriptional regulator [Planctomycetota bacterium]
MSTVLVVDDKEMLRDSVGVTLQRAGFSVVAAPGGERALEIVASRRPDAVVTDLKMPGMDGITLTQRLRELDEDLPIVLMTAFGTVETAVKAMRLGAFDYITKPFEGDELIISVKRAIEHAKLKRENAVLRASSNDAPDLAGLDAIVGESAPMLELKERLRSIATSHGTVLISGESGTGKEVVARAIHQTSPRRDAPFLAVNCAAMSESLLESELFGHERGAFTGADRLRKGRFELADDGTLLLDEISEVKPQIQAKLLRVLQERAFERVGSSATIGVDVRVIATTNRDLSREIDRGEFRQDLFYRLNVLPVHIPPLRDRAGDVGRLARHFVERACAREGRETLPLTEEAVGALAAYPWPGNVRELQNLCERAVVLCRGDAIDDALLRPWLASPGAVRATPLVRSPEVSVARVRPASMSTESVKPLADIEREVIVETLHRFNGHRQKTAQALGIGVRTLGLKLKKWKQERIVPESL